VAGKDGYSLFICALAAGWVRVIFQYASCPSHEVRHLFLGKSTGLGLSLETEAQFNVGLLSYYESRSPFQSACSCRVARRCALLDLHEEQHSRYNSWFSY
jgi:hypothetical protein